MNPDDISADLFARNVITKNEKAEADLQMFTTQVRMDKLLAAVQRAINIDPQNYETFLDILDKEKKYSALGKEMRGSFHMYHIGYCCIPHTYFVIESCIG